jgi:hypothetical protein
MRRGRLTFLDGMLQVRPRERKDRPMDFSRIDKILREWGSNRLDQDARHNYQLRGASIRRKR